jgi:hypothetical protein
MDASWFGLIGGVAGGTVGVIGGAVGTWYGIRAVPPGPARRFAVRWAITLWIGVTALVTLELLLPFVYACLVSPFYLLFLYWYIRSGMSKLTRILAGQDAPADGRESREYLP